MQQSHGLIEQMERLIRRDPARRGLLATPEIDSIFPLGQLELAAEDLARNCRHAWIVTGFYIPRAIPPSPESDGPPGALLLARILHDLGHSVEILTDPLCSRLLRETARLYGLPIEMVREIPDSAVEELYSHPPGDLTHLIAIERVGPSHTLDSLIAQSRSGSAPVTEFERTVPIGSRDRCHNMRGDIIDAHTGHLHQLFTELPQGNPSLWTIGIGDGGNEIGMGRIPWETLAARLAVATSPKTICRIATDWNILAGTSNWGGYALAAAVALLRKRTDLLVPWGADREYEILSELVENRLAVDGVTREYQPTVDGLPFLAYIQPWSSIRQLLELEGQG